MIKEEDTLNALRLILKSVGEDASREGLLETPQRILKSWATLYGGYKVDPDTILKTFEADGYNEIILLKNIEMYSMCEHHMLPFIGKAHVAYIPNKRVVGISKLARVVEMFSRRMQIQERLTEQVASFIQEKLEPKAVACIIEAQHLCMLMRGVNKQNSVMTTSSLKGEFLLNQKAREELMNLIRL